MLGRIVAKIGWQFVPLTAGAQLIDQAVERASLTRRGSARALVRPERNQNWFEDRPQRIVDFPIASTVLVSAI